MPKFTLEFEADDFTHLMQQLLDMIGSTPATAAAVVGAMEARSIDFPDDQKSEAEPEAALANGEAGKRGRGRPKKSTVTPVEAQSEPLTPVTAKAKALAPEPETPKAPPSTAAMLAASTQALNLDAFPPLDVLKAAITTAVRQAQKGEGDPAILGLLPGFKTETGLPFVMNAQEEHRPALFNLIKQAGLTLG